jgi:hypothetical protein
MQRDFLQAVDRQVKTASSGPEARLLKTRYIYEIEGIPAQVERFNRYLR